MRTYLGKFIDESLVNEKGFTATVREDGFDVKIIEGLLGKKLFKD